MKYVFMGDALGGRPSDPTLFDDDGRVNYIKVAETNSFQLGVGRLKTSVRKGFVSCLLCSESKPETCHRCKLIGAELECIGIEVIHIDEKGFEISQQRAMARLTKGQDDMFGDPALVRSRGIYGGG